MLLLRFQGGLGNQMFQYAALHSIGKQTSQLTAYAGLPYRLSTRIRLALQRIIKPPLFPLAAIETAFPYFFEQRYRNLFKAILFRGRYPIGVPKYTEKSISLEPNLRPLTVFDSTFLNIRGGGELSGFFQSEEYFARDRSDLLSRFIPRKKHLQEAEQILKASSLAPQETCCLHVRRGDYLTMRNFGRAEGWALPSTYYHDAIAKLPKSTKLVIISDDIPWCREHFTSYSPQFVTQSSAAVVDLWLMTLCRFNIISNSSFSWWGAWLNDDPDKVVYTPQHFLGFAVGQTLPGSVTPKSWCEIPVRLDR